MPDHISRLFGFPSLSENLGHVAQEITSSILASHRRAARPRLIHTAGIPGSGQSTYLADYAKRSSADFAILIFDDIMQGLPGYREDAAKDPAEAFKKWELPARMITYRVLDALINAGISVLFEHGGSNQLHRNLLRYTRRVKRYHTEMHFLDCPIDIARGRVRARNRQGERHLPEQALMSRQALLKALLPQYRSLVNEFITIDSRRVPFRPKLRLESPHRAP